MANLYQNLIDNYTLPAAMVGRAASRVGQQLAREAARADVKPATAFATTNEVTVIAAFGGTANAGNFTLTVNLPTRSITYTTANIAYNAAAATIEAALDTASPATVPDGDINVAASATDFTDGNMTFTCNGSANVSNMPVLITIANVNLSGTAPTVGAVTRSTPGQTTRNAAQALLELNIIDGTIPDCGEASTDWNLPTAAGDYVGWSRRVRLETIDWLAQQLKLEEGINDNRDALRALYNLPEALYGPHTS